MNKNRDRITRAERKARALRKIVPGKSGLLDIGANKQKRDMTMNYAADTKLMNKSVNKILKGNSKSMGINMTPAEFRYMKDTTEGFNPSETQNTTVVAHCGVSWTDEEAQWIRDNPPDIKIKINGQTLDKQE